MSLVPNQVIKIKVGGKTTKHFRELGYEFKGTGAVLSVPPEHLKSTSHQQILLQCDKCGKMFYRPYRDYLKYNSKRGGDYCRDCSNDEIRKQTCIEKYGVDNPMKKEEVKNKCINARFENHKDNYKDWLNELNKRIKNTTNERYGCNHYTQSSDYKRRRLKTSLERYGVEWYTQTEEYKARKIATCLEKYGGIAPLSSEEIKEKAKKTNLERYGVENVFASNDVKEKIKDYWQNKYGVNYYSQTDDFKTKYKATSIEKYGVETYLILPEIIKLRDDAIFKKYGTKYPMQSDLFWKEYYEKVTIKYSKQQKAVYDALKKYGYNVDINVPCGRCSLDVVAYFENCKIDIEYDGWYWHQDKRKDRARDEFVKKQGYKVLRIKGGTLLPSNDELFKKISGLVTSIHTFDKIILPDWREVKTA